MAEGGEWINEQRWQETATDQRANTVPQPHLVRGFTTWGVDKKYVTESKLVCNPLLDVHLFVIVLCIATACNSHFRV